MNKWEKQVQRSLLKDEQRILRILELMYRDVLREVQDRMLVYYNRVIVDPADAAAVYQLRYQQALAQQLSDILDGFEDKNYTSIQSYLEDCYTNGYVGAMYDIHRQGIPVVTPIQQENVVRAITTDSKISVPMYTRLGNNIAQLKTAIAAEVTRGIASGTSWHDTAAGISRQGQVSAYNAMRIARTEGHRIACEAQMDGCRDARDAGADVVKQWSAAHDERTREHHRQLDGQLRELDEPFEVAGIRVQYPGSFGRPEEDIHCRCALLQRARWALSEEELAQLRSTKAAQALAEIEDFSEFKGKYLELAGQNGISEDISADDSTEKSDKTVDNSVESGIIETEGQRILREKLASGEVTSVLNPEKQKPHIYGSDSYLEADHKSYFTIPIENLQKLVELLKCSGQVYIKQDGQIKEVVEIPEGIAYVIDENGNNLGTTNRATIHYSKKRTHIVPAGRWSENEP